MSDRSDLYTLTSIFGAITAQQENIEWALRCGAALVAIVAGIIAICQKLRALRRPRD
jgi:hypothetical protein